MKNVENYLAELAIASWQLPNKKDENSFVGDYTPEMYKIPAFEQELAS